MSAYDPKRTSGHRNADFGAAKSTIHQSLTDMSQSHPLPFRHVGLGLSGACPTPYWPRAKSALKSYKVKRADLAISSACGLAPDDTVFASARRSRLARFS